MGDPFFDLGNFSINHELTPDEDEILLAAYDGAVRPDRLARLTLMRIVSDFREAMWGVLQQGVSTLDVDFVAYAAGNFDRLLRNASGPRFEDALARSRYPDARDRPRRRSRGSPVRSVALGVVVFAATLILLFGALNVVQRLARPVRPARPASSAASTTARRPSAGGAVGVEPLRLGCGRRRRRVAVSVRRRRRSRPSSSAPATSPTAALTGDTATAALIDGHPGHRLHRRRQRLPERHGEPVPRLLRPDLGRVQGPDAAGARQPRLADEGPRRLPRLLRRGGRAERDELVLVRPRGVARHRPRLGLREGGRLRRGLAAGSMAGRGPRGVDRAVHARDLASPAVQLRAPRQRHRGRAVLAARSTTPAPTSSSTATTTTTSGSRRRTRMATRTARAASASSSSGPAAPSCARSS